MNRTSFKGLGSLKHLLLSWNRICTVDYHLLEDLPLLKTLDLSGNVIQQTNADIVGPYVNLRSINLGRNIIENITQNAFFVAFLPGLRSLYLSYNKIQSFDVNPSDFNTSLEILDLQINYLENIFQITFIQAVLPRLKVLKLSNGLIKETDLGLLFHSGIILETLWLQGNRIKQIPRCIFDKIIQVPNVNLGYNMITIQYSITNKSCSHTSQDEGVHCLQNRHSGLYLQSNRIGFLNKGLFVSSSKFKSLHLDNNDIKEIETGCFCGLSCLEDLNLDDNEVG